MQGIYSVSIHIVKALCNLSSCKECNKCDVVVNSRILAEIIRLCVKWQGVLEGNRVIKGDDRKVRRVLGVFTIRQAVYVIIF